LRTAIAEIDGGQFGFGDEGGEVVAGAEPGQDAIALPAPRDDFFLGDIHAQMPAMLLGIIRNPLMDAVVVPTKGEQNAGGFVAHNRNLSTRKVLGKQHLEGGGEISMLMEDSPRTIPLKRGPGMTIDVFFGFVSVERNRENCRWNTSSICWQLTGIESKDEKCK